MKTIKLFFSTLLVVIISAIGMVSCNDDDELKDRWSKLLCRSEQGTGSVHRLTLSWTAASPRFTFQWIVRDICSKRKGWMAVFVFPLPTKERINETVTLWQILCYPRHCIVCQEKGHHPLNCCRPYLWWRGQSLAATAPWTAMRG